jgi:hypothetical protein
MRTDCKHYESRSYANGETVRKCKLDLAPEAPWHCPADCVAYSRRMVDAGWTYGSLADAMGDSPPEPAVPVGEDVAALLDAAEDIVNAAGEGILQEMAAKEAKAERRKRFRKRK